ncbi:acyl-homoserine-lactone synthase [Acidithiobacillus ferrivorans]|uniref:acyl-homoserine-lactone synthase n=1 Tax=Acidithiobacillus ferrivorans TaxID=160808 RepID=UPI001C072E02|nr:acyl-homoserine-lactone synthase [Acidithiobacillus ferrivorans]MBU2849947.1 N-acylhomoserine lactone synthase [Acidithiobacillus ferrivorans]
MQVISGAAETLPNNLYPRVAGYRHQVFVERLGWPLHTENGMESDQFDRPDTVYVVAQDVHGHITGCARLLPTTGPYLLGEVFPQLLNGLPLPCSPDVWELSRFAAIEPKKQNVVASSVARQLLVESLVCAVGHGARRVITVTSIGVERLLSRSGFHAYRAGPPIIYDGQMVVACWIDMECNSHLNAMKSFIHEYYDDQSESRRI